jgi:hypothetical protein
MLSLCPRTMELVKLMAADVAKEVMGASNSRVVDRVRVVEARERLRLVAMAALAARAIVAVVTAAANAVAANSDLVITETNAAAMNPMLVRKKEDADANARAEHFYAS